MENRIKEQFSLFADRVSAETMRANQLRLYLSSMAYVLVEALRRLGLAGTELAEAQVDTIRTKLLKIGAQVRVTVRKVWVRWRPVIPGRTSSPQLTQLCAAEKPTLTKTDASSRSRARCAQKPFPCQSRLDPHRTKSKTARRLGPRHQNQPSTTHFTTSIHNW